MSSLTHQTASTLWFVRLSTGLFAIVASGCMVFWMIQFTDVPSPLSVPLTAAATPVIDSRQMARLLGSFEEKNASRPTNNTQHGASTYKLLGVIANGQHRGSALIAVGDKSAKPYRVGDSLTPNLMLQAVHLRSVQLGVSPEAATTVTLELPPASSSR